MIPGHETHTAPQETYLAFIRVNGEPPAFVSVLADNEKHATEEIISSLKGWGYEPSDIEVVHIQPASLTHQVVRGTGHG